MLHLSRRDQLSYQPQRRRSATSSADEAMRDRPRMPRNRTLRDGDVHYRSCGGLHGPSWRVPPRQRLRMCRPVLGRRTEEGDVLLLRYGVRAAHCSGITSNPSPGSNGLLRLLSGT
jgi:hypothetical protein